MPVFLCFFCDIPVFICACNMCMVLHVPELHVLAVRPPRLAWLKSGIATALKPSHEAGGRGGESTARWRWC
ncbi:hypothetical protein EER51_13310 [Escherichia coli]|nr:hypothetical protein [Escherichia coli]